MTQSSTEVKNCAIASLTIELTWMLVNLVFIFSNHLPFIVTILGNPHMHKSDLFHFITKHIVNHFHFIPKSPKLHSSCISCSRQIIFCHHLEQLQAKIGVISKDSILMRHIYERNFINHYLPCIFLIYHFMLERELEWMLLCLSIIFQSCNNLLAQVHVNKMRRIIISTSDSYFSTEMIPKCSFSIISTLNNEDQ